MVARNVRARKAKFTAALRQAKWSAGRFAREAGVSRTHLYRVLNKPSESAPLIAKIDAFIHAHVPDAVIAA